jgi:hypothetical protein
MVGEKYIAGVIKESLGLTPEDTQALQDFIKTMREEGPGIMEQLPEYLARVEATERRVMSTELRVQALCFYFKNMDPVAWGEAEAQAINYFKKKDDKSGPQKEG